MLVDEELGAPVYVEARGHLAARQHRVDRIGLSLVHVQAPGSFDPQPHLDVLALERTNGEVLGGVAVTLGRLVGAVVNDDQVV